jgi:hypothetical protein
MDNIDITQVICDLLTNRECFAYLSTNKDMHDLKNKLLFNSKVKVNKIYYSPYYDRFTNLAFVRLQKFSKNTRRITMRNVFNEPISISIPNSVTHLTFGGDFNQSINP